MTVLDQIVARTRERLKSEPMDIEDTRRAAMDQAARRTPFAFSKALRVGQTLLSVLPAHATDKSVCPTRIIAEIKAASPSAGTIVDDPDIETIAADYQRGGAAALSIVTEPEFFRGSHGWIARAKAATGLPVVMKDFVVEPSQLMRGIAAGADAILLLASLLDADRIRDFIGLLDAYGCDALVETHDEFELQRAIDGGARLIGANNRNLQDFSVDLATSERLGALMPADAIRVAESGIKTRADVDRLRAAGFHAFLVGESLLRQNDRARAVRELMAS